MRLFLHFGTHKTGTSTLQRILSENREYLSAQGLCYPDSIPVFGRDAVNHVFFANALTQSHPNHLTQVDSFLNYLSTMGEHSNTIILSAEQFYRHVYGRDWWGGGLDTYWDLRQRYIEEIRSKLQDFQIEAIISIREKTSFQESMYRELVKKNRFLRSKEDFLVEYAPLFDYTRQINLIKNILGKVIVYSYEDALKNGLAATFFKIIGYEMPLGSESVWENKTP